MLFYSGRKKACFFLPVSIGPKDNGPRRCPAVASCILYTTSRGIWYTVYQASLASSILYTKAGWYTVYQTHVAAHWLCCAALLPGWLPGCVALSIGRASPAKVQIALSRLEARL